MSGRDGTGWGLHLHRHYKPKDWPRLLEQMVPEKHRAEAEKYLRGIAARMRVRRAVRASLAAQGGRSTRGGDRDA